MNSRKAILYLSIMILIPMIGGYIFYEMLPRTTSSLCMAVITALYLNGQLFFLGFVVEGVKYIRGKYKDTQKVFWWEWVETTFSLWILGVVIIGIAVSLKRFT